MKKFALLVAAWLMAACAMAPGPVGDPGPLLPEGSSGWNAQAGRATRQFAVAAANPLAADAGRRILRAGGSAVDAAIAVQMVLTLVEPQSSGIGGGAFLLHFDGRDVEAYDGRETAPAAADERLFLGTDGMPLSFAQAVVGGRAVGVPGVVPMLEMAHRQHGRLPWAVLFEPAIALAERGFPVSPRLHTLLTGDAHLKKDPVAAAYFFGPDGRAHPPGHLLRNPDLAHVLRKIAAEGARGLIAGPVADAIVDKVRGHATNPGLLGLADLAGYQPRRRAALCHGYRARERDYRICGFPPPSSGGIAVGQILGMLGHTPAGSMPPDPASGQPGAEWLHLYTEAARLALADRAQYLADPDFVAPPAGQWASLLDPAYLAARARLIQPQGPRMPAAPAGTPGAGPVVHAPMAQQPEYGTSHISIVDAHGNALALTSSIEDAFGSRQMVNTGGPRMGGFLLNNELTDFSFVPTDAQGRPVANRVGPGKRPRSSMAPTLVFDGSGQLLMSTGSPGGAQIIHFTAKTLYAVLNWGLDAQQAINLPNFAVTGDTLLLEDQRFAAATVQALRARGSEVRERALTSGVQAIVRTPSGWFGGADPRREGVVLGD